VILNHTGTYEDMFTMAHELGHAVHDILAGKNSSLSFHPPLVLAESASTFAETLLFNAEIKEANKEQRIALISKRIDDMIVTIVSQMRYTHFEEQAHDMLSNGVKPEEINKLWVKLLKEDFPAIEFPESSVQWTAIPHIYHSPFYCYSYAFGLLLVLSLYRRYEEEGDVFVEKFKTLLEAGGSKPPAELLQELGYDITDEAFWGGGFSVIREYVAELRKLVG
jgi:oligoendopeptidase F